MIGGGFFAGGLFLVDSSSLGLGVDFFGFLVKVEVLVLGVVDHEGFGDSDFGVVSFSIHSESEFLFLLVDLLVLLE